MSGMAAPIQPGAIDLAVASSLVVLNAAISAYLGLRMQRQMLWSAIRMVVQLLLVGLVLRWVFALASPAATIAVALLMIVAAAREVATRPAHGLRGWAGVWLSTASVGLSSIATVVLALLTVLHPTPWYEPQYAIPLIGIVLGNVLNSASIGLDTFYGGAVNARGAIEAQLVLGATRNEALAPLIRDSVRKGLIPIINQMSAAGIITLPGIMTGQILAGMDPMDAVRYQILLMFLLAGGSGISVTLAVYLAARSITDERHRLRLERLRHR
jgi:putative ABC transport system permease protein